MNAFTKIGISLLVLILSIEPAVAQPTETPGESAQYRSQKALAEYYTCVKSYALKYTKAAAPASDVAEAALSACSNSGKALYSANLAFVRTMDNAEQLQKISVEAARRFAIQSLLEARFHIK